MAALSLRRRGRLVAAVATGLILAAGPLSARQQSKPLEYDVKAAFLFHFLRFIDWPESAFSRPNQPLRLCVIGRDPFGPLLGPTDELIAGRRVEVQRLKHEEAAASCQLVFVPESDLVRLPTIVKLTAGKGVLVVGETIRALEGCAAIALVLEGEHVRFDVSQPALRSQRLHASSRLLRVARDRSFTPTRCHF